VRIGDGSIAEARWLSRRGIGRHDTTRPRLPNGVI
jgi:hypothetical protein